MHEPAAAKAGRYLKEGRIIVTAVTANTVHALARGDGKINEITGNGNAWSCTCPVRSDCAHLLAVRRVVAVDIDGTGTSARSGGGGYKAGITSCTPAPALQQEWPTVIDQLTKGNKI